MWVIPRTNTTAKALSPVARTIPVAAQARSADGSTPGSAALTLIRVRSDRWPRTDLITIVVADDQRLIRDGICVILDNEPGMSVIGEASDGLEAVSVVERLHPRVVLMDIQMPVLDGLQAARRILLAPRATSVLMLTTFDDDEYIYQALHSGASGFLLKDSPQSQLVEAVRAVAAGGALIDPLTTRRLIGRFTSAVRPAVDVPSVLGVLTGREARRAQAGGRGPVQWRDRRTACRGGKHHQDPRRAHPGQAELAGPSASGGPGLRDRVRQD